MIGGISDFMIFLPQLQKKLIDIIVLYFFDLP